MRKRGGIKRIQMAVVFAVKIAIFPDININATSNSTQIFILDNKKFDKHHLKKYNKWQMGKKFIFFSLFFFAWDFFLPRDCEKCTNLHYFLLCCFVCARRIQAMMRTPSMSSSETYWISIQSETFGEKSKCEGTWLTRKRANENIERKRKFIEIRNWNWIEIEQYKSWNCVRALKANIVVEYIRILAEWFGIGLRIVCMQTE